jgi:hypothetical protein
MYKGKCIGRLIDFLEEYDPYNDRPHSVVFQGEDKKPMITLYGKPYANYVWTEGDVPVFEFLGENKEWLTKVQETKKKDVIQIDKDVKSLDQFIHEIKKDNKQYDGIEECNPCKDCSKLPTCDDDICPFFS